MTKSQNIEPLNSDALIMNELDRRFYIYLVGGEFEQRYYSLLRGIKDDDQLGSGGQVMSRIKLDIEAEHEKERQNQARFAQAPDADYQRMLEFIINKKLAHRVEKDEELLIQCPVINDILPLIRLAFQSNIDAQAVFAEVHNIPWLSKAIMQFASNGNIAKHFQITSKDGIGQILQRVGPEFIICLLPRMFADEAQQFVTPGLSTAFKKIRMFGRMMASASMYLSKFSLKADLPVWQYGMLSSLNCLPLLLLLLTCSDTIEEEVRCQRNLLAADQDNDLKLSILNDICISDDHLSDLLQLDELIKPFLFESLEIKGFDLMEYVTGNEKGQCRDVLTQARAYAFYLQLYKTERINKRETEVYLKRCGISEYVIKNLNSLNLLSWQTHYELATNQI